MATALAQCIFFVGMGSNDYLNNYLMPNYPTRNQYNGQQYADLLVQTYRQQLTVTFLSFSYTIKLKLLFCQIWILYRIFLCCSCAILSKYNDSH